MHIFVNTYYNYIFLTQHNPTYKSFLTINNQFKTYVFIQIEYAYFGLLVY
jgi:hypothetical protein